MFGGSLGVCSLLELFFFIYKNIGRGEQSMCSVFQQQLNLTRGIIPAETSPCLQALLLLIPSGCSLLCSCKTRLQRKPALTYRAVMYMVLPQAVDMGKELSQELEALPPHPAFYCCLKYLSSFIRPLVFYKKCKLYRSLKFSCGGCVC